MTFPTTKSLPPIPFRAVNRAGAPGHDSGLQRYHILPREILLERCFGRMFAQIGRRQAGFDDFRRNGLLLPAQEAAALRLGLPLHGGPHKAYNALVIARVGQVEAVWSDQRRKSAERATELALMQLGLLQRALRRRLLDPVSARIRLNRKDPLGARLDFSELDAMADALWGATEPFQPETAPVRRARSESAS